MDTKKLYERIFLRTGIIILTILLFVYLGPALLDALLPIILALILVLSISPLIRKIDEAIPIKHKIISYIVGTILMLVVLFVVIWLVQLVANQVIGLVGNIIGNWSKIQRSTNELINSTDSKINLLPDYVENAIRSGLDSLYGFLGRLQENAINITFGFTTAFINTSNDIIFFVITFIVAFYIILGDIQNAQSRYVTILPEHSRNNLSIVNKVFKLSTWNYIKAQLKMGILCAVLTAITLKLVGQQYYIPLAILIGIIDLLPLVGPIIFLLPWSAIEFLVFNNNTKGLVIMVFLLAWTGLRQVIAPKIIGESADIHPLLSVIALYGGLRLFGLTGAIIFPIIVIFIVGVLKSGLIDNWIYDYKTFFSYVSNLLNIGKRDLKIPTDEK